MESKQLLENFLNKNIHTQRCTYLKKTKCFYRDML